MQLDEVGNIEPELLSAGSSNIGLGKIKVIFAFLMVLGLVVAAFAGGFYFSEKDKVDYCNQFITENNLVQEVKHGESKTLNSFNFTPN